jgi:polar amino acid transport system substrate-binding protein
MRSRTLLALLGGAVLLAACSGGASPTPADLLKVVTDAGTIRVSTDPQYPPQSELAPDGSYRGFDIDVATAIAEGLGVEIAWETPSWDTITAGSWGGRWDLSVGSMTITTGRQGALVFSEPYYFTPAQMTASTASGITTLDGLAGETVCVGEATTYLDWLTGQSTVVSETAAADPPEGVEAITQTTDRLCAESWKAGRSDWAGWLTSSSTVEDAIADGLPLIAVGDPVYIEQLAVAADKGGPDPTALIAKVNEIIGGMHADGTLATLSEEWFGKDLTKLPGS